MGFVALGKLKGFIKLLRPPVLLSFSFCSCVGSLVAVKTLNLPTFLFAVFCISLFLAVNDLSDEKLDRFAGKLRNPLVGGELKPADVKLISIACFLGCVLLLPSITLSLGVLSIFLSLSYSLFLRTKGRPLLDLVWHGLFLANLTAIGYLQYKPLDTPLLILFSGIFLLSVASELMQEIHGYETDLNNVHTTVTTLGKNRGITVLKMCLLGSLAIYFISIIVGVLPKKMLFAVPIFPILVPPLSHMENSAGAIKTFYRRSFIIIVALAVLLIA